MSDDWILDLSADGGIELTRQGGATDGTGFPPIIIIRGWHDVGDAPASELANRYFLRATADGASRSHYILGGAETDLSASAVVDAVAARLTHYNPESGTFRATLDGLQGP